MSKIETTSKVSLKLTSRINLGRRGAHVPSSRLWTQPTSTHTARKALIPNPQEKAAPHGPDGSTHKSALNPPPQEYPRHYPPKPNQTPHNPPTDARRTRRTSHRNENAGPLAPYALLSETLIHCWNPALSLLPWNIRNSRS